MFHWFGTVTNTRGDSLSDWQIECVTLAGSVVPIFADENSTPILSVSGIANRAKSDADGNYDFYVPSGTYSLRFYNSAGEFQRTQRFLPMYGQDFATDAASVDFTPTGTGAVTRPLSSKLFRQPEDQGVTFDGSVADATRIANFFDIAAPTTGYDGEFFRNGGRAYLGDWSVFNGAFGGLAELTGLTPQTLGLHNWAPREATLGVDSHWGSMAIVGSSQASKVTNWPAASTAIPPTIGVSGFSINDVANGQSWGGYFDAVRLPSANGFTTAAEFAMANFGDVNDTSAFTLIDGSAKGGALIWTQSGAGMSLIPSDLASLSLTPSDVNHTSVIAAFLPMQQLSLTYPAWANSTAYAVGDIREDPTSNLLFRCVTAHTSPGSGTFADDRAANPTRWKQNPGSMKGLVFGVGSLAERAAGLNFFEAIEMPERHAITWTRKTSGGAVEQSATVYCEFIPDGSPVVQMAFRQNAIFSNGLWAGNADGTVGAKIQGRGAGQTISFNWTGTDLQVFVDNTLVKTI